MWFTYSIISLVSIVGYRIFQKKYISDDRVDPVAFGIAESIWTIILTIPLVAYFGFNFSGGNIEIILLIAKSFISGLAAILLYLSLSKIAASDFQIINSLIQLFTLIFGIALFHEILTLNKILAILLVFSATLLIFWQDKKINFNKFYSFAFISTLAFAIVYTTDKYLVSYFNNFTYLLLSFIISQIFKILLFPRKAALIPIIIKKDRNLFYTAITGFFLFGIYLFQYFAYQTGGDLSSVNIIKGTATIFIVLLSIILLNDRKNITKKIIASFLVFTAILILTKS